MWHTWNYILSNWSYLCVRRHYNSSQRPVQFQYPLKWHLLKIVCLFPHVIFSVDIQLLNKGCFNNSNLISKGAIHLSKVRGKSVNFISLWHCMYLSYSYILMSIIQSFFLLFLKKSRDPKSFYYCTIHCFTSSFLQKFPCNHFYIWTNPNRMLLS